MMLMLKQYQHADTDHDVDGDDDDNENDRDPHPLPLYPDSRERLVDMCAGELQQGTAMTSVRGFIHAGRWKMPPTPPTPLQRCHTSVGPVGASLQIVRREYRPV